MKRFFFETLKVVISALTVWLIFVAHPLGYSSFLILTIGLSLVAAVLLLEASLTEDCGIVCMKDGCKKRRPAQHLQGENDG